MNNVIGIGWKRLHKVEFSLIDPWCNGLKENIEEILDLKSRLKNVGRQVNSGVVQYRKLCVSVDGGVKCTVNFVQSIVGSVGCTEYFYHCKLHSELWKNALVMV